MRKIFVLAFALMIPIVFSISTKPEKHGIGIENRTHEKLDPILKDIAENKTFDYVEILIKFSDDVEVTPNGLIFKSLDDENSYKQLNISIKKRFSFMNTIQANVSSDLIAILNSSSFVKNMAYAERQLTYKLDHSTQQIKTDEAWSVGINGSNVKVCILDSGIDADHPALQDRIRAMQDFTGTGIEDKEGHGTHVAGIIASNDEVYRGIAYGSDLYIAKVCPNRSCLLKDVFEGLVWCFEQDVDVISISFGDDHGSDGSDILSQALDNLVDDGINVVVAAGNCGDCASNDCGNFRGITTPADAHKIITVGAVDDSDRIACFSSRGPTSDFRIKPELTAPGVSIKSTYKNGEYRELSGTSMSAPHVSGLVALLKQYNPNLTPSEIKVILMNSADDLGLNKMDNEYGSGRVNAKRMLETNVVSGSVQNRQSVYYEIDVNSTENGKITLYWDEDYATHNDLDLYLIDPYGNLTDYSISHYNVAEQVVIPENKEGRWKVEIYGFSVNGEQNYYIASDFPISGPFTHLQNISELKSEIEDIRRENEGLKATVSSLEERIALIETNVTDVRNTTDVLQNALDGISRIISDIINAVCGAHLYAFSFCPKTMTTTTSATTTTRTSITTTKITTTPTTTTSTALPECIVICEKRTTSCSVSCRGTCTSEFDYCEYSWNSICADKEGIIKSGENLPWMVCPLRGTCVVRGCK